MKSIQVKLPNASILYFDCPQQWTASQIIFFCSKYQNQFQIPPDKTLKLNIFGRDVENHQKLQDIIQNLEVVAENIIFVATLQNKLEQERQKDIIYNNYFENLLQLEQSKYNSNYHDMANYFPLAGMELATKKQISEHHNQLIRNVQQHQIFNNNQNNINNDAFFFHFRQVFQLAIFFGLTYQHFKGIFFVGLIIAMSGYYWIKYLEFRNQQIRAQQQDQQEPQEQQQQNVPEQQQNQENEQNNENQEEQQQNIQLQQEKVDDEPELEEEMKKLQLQKKRKNPFVAFYELIVCYFLSLFPQWHVGLYNR
ncbi:hypothetical protein pb186bvf_004279 [Paramecium bursaria]